MHLSDQYQTTLQGSGNSESNLGNLLVPHPPLTHLANHLTAGVIHAYVAITDTVAETIKDFS